MWRKRFDVWKRGVDLLGKHLAKKLIGPTLLGVLDYFRDGTLHESYGGPFNGQHFRRKMVEEVIHAIKPTFVVETGTYKGATTECLAKLTSVPIHTIEHERRFYGFSLMRLRHFPHVHPHNGDSRLVLARLLRTGVLPKTTGLFYLDAHGDSDLPLQGELELIFRTWESALILIDDFEVPGDPGYHFDDYGPGKTLTLDYIHPMHRAYGFEVWFPECSSEQESGSRRGCALLARGSVCDTLGRLNSMRRWDW